MQKTEQLNWAVKAVNQEEWKSIVSAWMKGEEWDHGIDDEVRFFNVDPNGFFIGYVDETPVSCLSAIKSNDQYAHMGHYIVRSDYRGQGWGARLAEHGFQYLEGYNIAIYGIRNQAKNFEKLGFVPHYKTYRFILKHQKKANIALNDHDMDEIQQHNLADFIQYDAFMSGIDRTKLFELWFSGKGRKGYLYKENGCILGAISIRPSFEGYWIGPFYAQNVQVLTQLFYKALETVPLGSNITIDVPEMADDFLNLLKQHDITEQAQTFHMHRGAALVGQLQYLQAIASLELG